MAPKLPLLGIDWLGGIMWAAFLLQVAFFFNYGQFYDWWNSPVMRRLAVSGVLTLLICIGRMISVRHPFYEPQMWRYRHLVPVLFLLFLLYDMPVRRRLKLMPLWRAVRNEAAGYLRRISFRQ